MTEAPPGAAQANTRAVALSISRCAESLLDVDRLRGETNVLKGLTGPLAIFASCLFELECAKKGDPDARANMLDTADRLLQYWRDGSGEALAANHATLAHLWVDASAMLISFEKKRIDRALSACWQARGDATLLQQALADLTPAGDRRVEFATCLYHLELARLFVDSSRIEFARRIGLVHEAYHDPEIAALLVGSDVGLKALWQDLVPYLDEFFEAQEQEEEARRRADTAATDPNLAAVPAVTAPSPRPPPSAPSAQMPSPAPTPPMLAPPATPPKAAPLPSSISDVDLGIVSESTLLTSSPDAAQPPAETVLSEEIEIVEARDITPRPAPPPLGDEMVDARDITPRPARPPLGDEPVEAGDITPRPARPALRDDAPPPPPKTVSQDSEVEIVELEEAPVPPKPVARDLDVLVHYEPNDEAQAFWRHTEVALGLLPDTAAPRAGARVLSADSRGDRKKLNGWLDGLTGRFVDLPDARAMQCLMRLYMAAHVKEKTLFGQPNPKRKEAFCSALKLLSADGAASGRAAVWFDLDGPETLEKLQAGIEVVQEFLQFCARQKLDPLDGAAADEFMGL